MSYFLKQAKRPHPYQRGAIGCTIWGWRKGYRSQLIVLPTGAGKTIVFGLIAGYIKKLRRFFGMGRDPRVLVLAHRNWLIEQAVDKLRDVGVPTVIEKADQRARSLVALGSRVVVASVQTLKGDRLEGWPRDTFDLVIIDEAHRATATSYRKVIEHFSSARLIGVTATDRSDGVKLGDVFERKSYEMKLAAAIEQGWLVPVLGVRASHQVDLTGIRTTGKDFDVHDLDERVSLAVEPLAIATKKEMGDRKTIIFTPDVKSAHAAAEAFRQIGVRATSLDGKMDAREQKVALDHFEVGDTQVLVNCALFVEGYDYPPIEAVAIWRPTKSSTLLAQMVGRGTRTCTAIGKKDCLIIDFGWVIQDDSIKTVVDLFATDATPAADVKFARKVQEENPGIDPREALERAKAAREAKEAAAQMRADRLKVKVKDRPVNYKRVAFDVVAIRQAAGLNPLVASDGVIGMPLLESTAGKLAEIGYKSTAGMTEGQAAQEIARWEDRKMCGMSTLKQIEYLSKQGMDPAKVADMTNAEARGVIGNFMTQFKAGRKRSG